MVDAQIAVAASRLMGYWPLNPWAYAQGYMLPSLRDCGIAQLQNAPARGSFVVVWHVIALRLPVTPQIVILDFQLLLPLRNILLESLGVNRIARRGPHAWNLLFPILVECVHR